MASDAVLKQDRCDVLGEGRLGLSLWLIFRYCASRQSYRKHQEDSFGSGHKTSRPALPNRYSYAYLSQQRPNYTPQPKPLLPRCAESQSVLPRRCGSGKDAKPKIAYAMTGTESPQSNDLCRL